jgi:thioredoxin reductase (NADPH)
MRLTLLTRAYCHLCEEMRADIAPIVAAAAIPVDEIDVDTDEALAARWGDLVPVLLAGERELFHYRVDRAALTAYLADASR